MKPKLLNAKKNADLKGDETSDLLATSSSSELTKSVSLSHSTPQLERDRQARRAVELGMGHQLSSPNPEDGAQPYSHRAKSDTRRQEREQMDYRRMAERKNAISLFDAYMQVYELMVKTDPKLFRHAIRSIKKHKSFKLDMALVKKLKKVYPDELPNVFERLWLHQPDAKERLLKRKIFAESAITWRNRLVEKGAVKKETIELPRAEMLSGTPASGSMSPFTPFGGQAATEEIARTGYSESQGTQNTSVPYLRPINIAIADQHSHRPTRDQQIKIEDRRSKKGRQRTTSKSPKRGKKLEADFIDQVMIQNDSEITSETIRKDQDS